MDKLLSVKRDDNRLVKDVYNLNKNLIDLSFLPVDLFNKIAVKIDSVVTVLNKAKVREKVAEKIEENLKEEIN